MNLSAWLRKAAQDRLEQRQRAGPLASLANIEAFFRPYDALRGPRTRTRLGPHLQVIEAPRASGAHNA